MFVDRCSLGLNPALIDACINGILTSDYVEMVLIQLRVDDGDDWQVSLESFNALVSKGLHA